MTEPCPNPEPCADHPRVLPVAPCEHDVFDAVVEINRLTAVEGGPVTSYSASITVTCIGCKQPFMWMGAPVGLSPRLPMTSVDALELRAPLRPASAPAGFGEDGPGFSVRIDT